MQRSRHSSWGLLGPGVSCAVFLLLAALGCGRPLPVGNPVGEVGTYSNPLKIKLATGALVQNCPDPAIIHGQKPGDNYWYLYCTSNPLTDTDKDASGKFNYHLIPIHKSADLVNWTYEGDAFTSQPSWAKAPQGFWAPDIQYFNDKYYLYYTSSDTQAGGAAIGVATSDSPTGPWTQAPGPVVEPQKAPCCLDAADFRWVFDSNVTTGPDGQRYIYFGSYYGGIAVRKLSADGLSSDKSTQQEIVTADRYEGTFIVKHDNYYYMFVSATNCCNGPLTGYSVFAGRSQSPTGPFVDRDGVSFEPGRVGGTPVLANNGNRWVGTGHNSVFTDVSGQDWIVYHAIDRFDPYRGGTPGGDFPEKRHVLMDPLDWVDGWPTVRGGQRASDGEMPAPAAQQGQAAKYTMQLAQDDVPGAPIASLTDEFNGAALGSQWSWVREPDASSYGVENGALRFSEQEADLWTYLNSASVLTEATPAGNYMVETKVSLDVPATGCCYNYTQAGLVIYGDDDNFIKLTPFSLWYTRQIEFAKEVSPGAEGYPRYGNGVAGPVGENTWLRLAKRTQGDEETYTAYTSIDGTRWSKAGVWTHKLGANAKIGLVAMARVHEHPEFNAHFDYVRVYELK